jgi:hypothetical protein
VEIDVVEASDDGPPIELVVGDGLRVSVPARFDEATLRRVLSLLGWTP